MEFKPTEATKFDEGKTDMTMVEPEFIEGVASVMMFGQKKYTRNNWKSGSGLAVSRLLASLLRHIFAFIKGEDLDPESGLSHLYHASCNIMFIMYFLKHKPSNDDRFKQ